MTEKDDPSLSTGEATDLLRGLSQGRLAASEAVIESVRTETAKLRGELDEALLKNARLEGQLEAARAESELLRKGETTAMVGNWDELLELRALARVTEAYLTMGSDKSHAEGEPPRTLAALVSLRERLEGLLAAWRGRKRTEDGEADRETDG